MRAWFVEDAAIDASTLRWRIRGLTFKDLVTALATDAGFRSFWAARLGRPPFGAYCWECPPMTTDTSSRPFECVLVAAPELARMPPDPAPFAEHFRTARSVVTFGNLGGDATLIAPAPGSRESDYSHLASFMATAPMAQQDELWRTVGEAMQRRIGAQPVWLSTAGLGVAWLHVRLDNRPKYYRHAAYAVA